MTTDQSEPTPNYRIELSTDGRHKVSVVIDDPDDTDKALAWALDGTIRDAKTLVAVLLWDRLRG